MIDFDRTNPTPEDQIIKQNKLFTINPTVNVVRSTPNEVFIEIGSRSRYTHRISDDKSRGVFADFVTSFTEPADVNAVAETLGIDSETLTEFCDALERGRVLLPSTQADYAYLLTGLDWDPTRRDAAVSVLGQGRIADQVHAQITELVSTPVEVTANPVDAFDGADFVIVAADDLAPALCYDADELARAAGVPWHLTRIDGFELLVGPTFVPDGANYYDLDTMDESARVIRTPFLYGKAMAPDVKRSNKVPTFAAAIAAGWTVVAVAQHLWGKGSFLEDQIMRVDLERMEIIRDKVLRLPRNPVDMGMRADLRHPFL